MTRGQCPHGSLANGGGDATSDVCLECVLGREAAALARIAELEGAAEAARAEAFLWSSRHDSALDAAAKHARRVAELEGQLEESDHQFDKLDIEHSDLLKRKLRADLRIAELEGLLREVLPLLVGLREFFEAPGFQSSAVVAGDIAYTTARITAALERKP